MKIFFSDFFDVPTDVIEEYGAFDVSLINDLPLFIDPFLLFNSEKPTYQQLHQEILRYVRFLKEVSANGEIRKDLFEAWFTFREVKQNWLGFSKFGNQGHGLGMDFAQALHRNLHTVFRDFGEEAVTRSSHLEKLCLVRDGVGRDNISDFTTNLIKGFLAEFSQVFAQEHLRDDQRARVAINKARFSYETRSWVTERFELPYVNGDFVLLSPRDLLTKDESWINRPELLDRFRDIADALPNAALRAQVNEYLLRVLPDDPDASKREIREAVALAVDKFPEVLDYYIRAKEDDGAQATSTAGRRVAETERRFVDGIKTLVAEILVPEGFDKLPSNTYEEAKAKLLFFKDLIENKGGHRFFFSDGKRIDRESDLHLMYRLTFHGTPSDVSREVDDGRGPADFVVSRGVADKTIIEFKLGKNKQLKRNLQKQVAIYEKASDPTHPSLKAIVYLDGKEKATVERILDELNLVDSPHIVLIDARADNKPSGSKA